VGTQPITITCTRLTDEKSFVGVVNLNLLVQNNTEKTIKYVDGIAVFQNTFGDVIINEISGLDMKAFRITGPIEGGDSGTISYNWFFSNKTASQMSFAGTVTFTDGTESPFSTKTITFREVWGAKAKEAKAENSKIVWNIVGIVIGLVMMCSILFFCNGGMDYVSKSGSLEGKSENIATVEVKDYFAFNSSVNNVMVTSHNVTNSGNTYTVRGAVVIETNSTSTTKSYAVVIEWLDDEGDRYKVKSVKVG
jgi:hypothetical protein